MLLRYRYVETVQHPPLDLGLILTLKKLAQQGSNDRANRFQCVELFSSPPRLPTSVLLYLYSN